MEVCREWETAIVEYVDGVCQPETAQRLEAHLARCEACARAVLAQAQVKQALAQLEAEHAPAYLSRRIRDHARTAMRRRRLARFTVRLAFATAAMTVAVIVLWWGAYRPSLLMPPPTDESTLAQAIVQEYVGATSTGDFSDPSLQMLAREAQLKSVKMEPTLQ